MIVPGNCCQPTVGPCSKSLLTNPAVGAELNNAPIAFGPFTNICKSPAPLPSPVQFPNVDPVLATACKVIVAPSATNSLQSVPQSIPGVVERIVPAPAPLLLTLTKCAFCTR